jgi:predicted PurR-regulated permease PerM
VLLFVILILLDRSDLRDRILRLLGNNLNTATDTLDEAAMRIGTYLRMQLIINLSYGVPMALGLWLIGVPADAVVYFPAVIGFCRRPVLEHGVVDFGLNRGFGIDQQQHR